MLGYGADDFCEPYVNAQRINRYRKAYPEDKRTDQEIINELDYERSFKAKVDRLFRRKEKQK